MPVTLPGISVTKAAELLQTQDKIIKSFPEVASVWGKAGRAATATDPAPTEMVETVINLKPESEWRPGMTMDKLTTEMDKSLQFPGVANAWTMPIKARIDMLSTGIRTPVGVKVFGKDLAEIDTVARQIETAIRAVPGTSSAYAERAIGGYYLNVDPDRSQLARYGLMVGRRTERDCHGVRCRARYDHRRGPGTLHCQHSLSPSLPQQSRGHSQSGADPNTSRRDRAARRGGKGEPGARTIKHPY